MKNERVPDKDLDAIKKLIQEMLDKHHRPASEIVMDDVDVRDMLKISRRTALNYRQHLGLKFYKKENKIFYFLSDVIEFIKSDKPKNDQEE